ncbi:MAG: FAD-dependent monooxygenase, partial [Caldilineaceae bacterium]|nr:FAD-dependent monooxygenase [Caldilineaceae bacterium]
MRTQVGIIGSGPAGLMLSQILHNHGIESVILERQSRAYVEARIRAGVLEQGTVNMLREMGVHERMDAEGIVHHGFALAFDGRQERIDMHQLTGGSTVMVYGQTEVTKDLIAARLAAGGMLKYSAPAVAVEDYDGAHPRIVYEENGRRQE